jgi:EpsI family protein
LQTLLRPPQFVIAIILLVATLAISQGVEFREKIPLAKPFDGFPVDVGGWTGSRDAMEQVYIDSLDLSDYVIVNYTNGAGKYVNFYTAYYTSQLKGESIHSPATCLPGSGWEFKQDGSTTIPVAANGGEAMPVNRAFMEKNGVRQLSYYWFPQRGRILTNAYQLKFFNFWDALTRQRTDGALVRLITPVYESEEVAEDEEWLISFTKVIVPVLAEYLPK